MVADEKITADEWVGRTIAGKYRVEGLLGKGGMGLVLRARHLRLEEDVAIKILLPAMLEVPGMVARFVREARAASKIKSAHVVRVTDVDILDDGVPYMVMELLEGISIAALRRREGTFAVHDAARFVLEACDAIAEAHSLGIVHRDLKPANLFLARGRDGASTVKVLDFGISKVDAPGEQDTTKTGQMMGSPKYMAPEQMLSMHDVDARADIWSLGAILYDMVTGRTPFVADTVPQLCSAVLHDRPPHPRQFRPDLPEKLEVAILRCLMRDRADRFRDVGAFAAAIAPFAPTASPPDLLHAAMRSSLGTERGDDMPTLTVPPASEHGSASDTPNGSLVAPPSAPSGTVATWNNATTLGATRRRRVGIVAIAFGLAAIAGVWLMLRVRDREQSIVAPAQASTLATVSEPARPMEVAHVAAPATVTPAPSPAGEAPPGAPASANAADSSKAPGSLPVTPSTPRTPTKGPPRVSQPADHGAPDGDPFGGKRR